MTPAARAQAAIDILDEVVAAARDAGPAADTIVARYFKARRYAGSKDRRAVRELVYAAIRRAGERPHSGRAALIGLARKDPALRALFDGSPHGPAPIGRDETGAPGGIAPKWLEKKLNDALGRDALPALLQRAPLDLRVNILAATRDEMLAAFPGAEPTPHAADGIRLAEAIQIETSEPFLTGKVEVQDEGSQLLALAVAPAPGETVLDLCAGAGGKTLALAAAMGNFGQIIATDTDRARLQRLEPRALRAGISIVETRLLNPGDEARPLADLVDAADAVLIDAPCSGTGTWRRNPEARWRLTPERIERLTTVQARLVALAATLVKPGGSITYGVCSLLPEEGPAIVDAFLAAHPGWSESGRRRLDPASDGTDGFFFTRLHRPC